MSKFLDYIIIDDDTVNNTLCQMAIKRTLGEAYVKTFDVPEEGLSYINETYSKSEIPTVLFLDINMPTLTGWEFMEIYEKLENKIKKQFTIYILSSSVDERDRERAASYTSIAGYIEKPLKKEIIQSIASGQLKIDWGLS